jgi:xanthine/CO dehydrogenase XdhC/CoxF family maturation factor
MKELQAIIAHLCLGQTGSVLATLVEVEGSSYRRPGVRMLILEGRTRVGSISGGCLEEDLLAQSARVTSTGRAELVVYDTSAENDALWGVGLGCHGVVRILLEPLPARPDWAAVVAENLRTGRPTDLEVVWNNAPGPNGTRIAGAAPGPKAPGRIFADRIDPPQLLTLFGAGDDAQPLARIAHELGWKVTVADPRPALLTESRFPWAAGLVLGPAEELVARAAPPAASIVVVMTHHYLHDRPLLRHLLPLPLGYLGLLGPKKRAERLLADIAGEGFAVTDAMRARLRAPVGLDLGADSPEEIALSIIAEIAATLTGRDGRPLRERIRPIHA